MSVPIVEGRNIVRDYHIRGGLFGHDSVSHCFASEHLFG